MNKESSLAPKWIFLPSLPLHMYRTNCLHILAIRFGKFLGTNNVTLNRTRALDAQIYVEVDLKEEPVQGFPIVISNVTTIWQEPSMRN